MLYATSPRIHTLCSNIMVGGEDPTVSHFGSHHIDEPRPGFGSAIESLSRRRRIPGKWYAFQSRPDLQLRTTFHRSISKDNASFNLTPQRRPPLCLEYSDDDQQSQASTPPHSICARHPHRTSLPPKPRPSNPSRISPCRRHHFFRFHYPSTQAISPIRITICKAKR